MTEAPSAQIELYSAATCPYAQRTRLVLGAKGISFTLHNIDLANKPANFSAISPYGKVPVLCHGAHRVWESAIVNEYLEEVFPTPPLLPMAAADRALARIWIDFANSKFTPAFYKLLLAQSEASQQEWATELTNHLTFIETEGLGKGAGEGPFWLGASPSLVDLTYYPWFERWPVLTHYRGVAWPDQPRLQRWFEAVAALPYVQATAQPAAYHIQQYAKYATGTAAGKTAQDMQRYGQ